MNRPGTAVLVVAGLLAALVLGGTAAQGGRRAGQGRATAIAGRAEPVVGSTAACPRVPALPPASEAPGQVSTRVTAGLAPVPGLATATGGVTAQPLPVQSATALPPATLPLIAPGQVSELPPGVTGDAPAITVDATGTLAGGLVVDQLTRDLQPTERGYAGLQCGPPATDAWFVGGSATVGSVATLVMVNPDDAAAVVDIQIWSATGAVDSRAGRGVVVGAHGRTDVRLDTLAPGRDELAVHVAGTRGRTVAALWYVRGTARAPGGVEWVPLTGAPASRIVLAALPQGPGGRSVLLVNPGATQARVSLQLTGSDGQFVPTGLDNLSVPAGSSVLADLSPLLLAGPAAVTVVSDGPAVLAAGVADDDDGGPAREVSLAATAQPLRGPALLTDVDLDDRTDASLLLTATDGAATVDLVPIAVSGGLPTLPATVRLAVAAGSTTAFPLATLLPAGGGRLALQIAPAPNSGPVRVARYLRERAGDGPLATLQVLHGADLPRTRPQVAADPYAGAG